MNINCELSKSDYVKLLMHNIMPRGAGCLTKLLDLAVIAGLMYITILINRLAGHDIWNLAKSGVYLAILLAITVGIAAVIMVNRIYKKQHASSLPRRAELNENGITLWFPDGSIQLSWKALKRWSERKDYFYVYRSNDGIIAFPKRLFESPQQIADFRELLILNI